VKRKRMKKIEKKQDNEEKEQEIKIE